MAMLLSRVRDTRLARALLDGDRALAERWVAASYPGVYRMLRYLTGHRESAEDLTQQAFVAAWEALPAFRGECRLNTWLHRIAYHQYTHWLRRKRETVQLSDTIVADPGRLEGLTTIQVWQAMDTLPDELREPFLLYYARQFSIREIAEILGIPSGTVKSRLFTARARLRQALADTTPETESVAIQELAAGGRS